MNGGSTKDSLRVVTLLFAVALCSARAYAVPSNFNLIDSLTRAAVTKYCAKLSTLQELSISFTEHPARWLVMQNFQRSGCLHEADSKSSKPQTIMVGIRDCAIRYGLHPSDRDSLTRFARVELLIVELSTDPAVVEYSDFIARSDVSLVESPRYEFSSSIAPPPPSTFWDDVAEPLIILGALGATVALLFTVRSQ